MKKIIVFGRGWYYSSKKIDLLQKYEVVGYLDNAVKRGCCEIDDGIEARNPKDVSVFPDASIMIMSVHFIDMCRQLLQENVPEDKILFGMNEKPAYDRGEELLHNLGGQLVLSDEVLEVCVEDKKYIVEQMEDYKKAICMLENKKHNPLIDVIKNFPTKPVSRRFGGERGKAIDRVYIEKFLDENKEFIQGDVMEMGNNFYTKKYGGEVRNSLVLHVEGKGKDVLKGNLETGEGIQENWIDCLILTQTLQMIYSFDKVAHHIHRMLKPGGTALITAHHISVAPLSA